MTAWQGDNGSDRGEATLTEDTSMSQNTVADVSSCDNSCSPMAPTESFEFARIRAIYSLPLLVLLQRASSMLQEYWPEPDIERCMLLSVKTGGCTEDCRYCSQSAHHSTGLRAEALMGLEEILTQGHQALAAGATRFCLSAAWSRPPRGKDFDAILRAIGRLKRTGLDVCATLGALDEDAAISLRQAGLDFYNHNIDTSREYYRRVTSTRKFDDRLATIESVRRAGMRLCCGGILGMGESHRDRISMLAVIASMRPAPEGVPINVLVRIPGTPLEAVPPLRPLDLARMVAAVRIVLPTSRVKLAAGRAELSAEAQALCLMAGANAVFVGNRLLTTPLPGQKSDQALFSSLLEPLPLVDNEQPPLGYHA